MAYTYSYVKHIPYNYIYLGGVKYFIQKTKFYKYKSLTN